VVPRVSVFEIHPLLCDEWSSQVMHGIISILSLVHVLISIIRLSEAPPVCLYALIHRLPAPVLLKELPYGLVSVISPLQSDFSLIVLLHGLLDLLLDEAAIPLYHPLLSPHLRDLPRLPVDYLVQLDGLVAEPLDLVLQGAHLVVLQDRTGRVLRYLLVLSDVLLMLRDFLVEGEDHRLVMLVILEEEVIVQLVHMPLEFVVIGSDHHPHLLLSGGTRVQRCHESHLVCLRRLLPGVQRGGWGRLNRRVVT
jgi:hypothetical protein